MSNIFSIAGEYCTGGYCDFYTGGVSPSDIVLGSFSLTSDSGKEATVNLDAATFNINIAVDGQKIGLKGNEFITQGDGSWYIEKDTDSDTFKITITPL
ncbi:hypothetical protein [Wolbachia endosymbiont (group E) of Neria commutata]|uniref:hypothetical protein n=1 Tax=Wolbachia endosymbiont (group E) of Neria commutata TaxID=3066149 RepID=UPI003132B7B7